MQLTAVTKLYILWQSVRFHSEMKYRKMNECFISYLSTKSTSLTSSEINLRSSMKDTEHVVLEAKSTMYITSICCLYFIDKLAYAYTHVFYLLLSFMNPYINTYTQVHP